MWYKGLMFIKQKRCGRRLQYDIVSIKPFKGVITSLWNSISCLTLMWYAYQRKASMIGQIVTVYGSLFVNLSCSVNNDLYICMLMLKKIFVRVSLTNECTVHNIPANQRTAFCRSGRRGDLAHRHALSSGSDVPQCCSVIARSYMSVAVFYMKTIHKCSGLLSRGYMCVSALHQGATWVYLPYSEKLQECSCFTVRSYTNVAAEHWGATEMKLPYNEELQ